VDQTVHEHHASKLLSEIATSVGDVALRDAVFVAACAVAWGDGVVSQRKALVMHALGHALGFSEGKLQSLLTRIRQVL
jgi:hypothetical protein